jgi:hypothetical protein
MMCVDNKIIIIKTLIITNAHSILMEWGDYYCYHSRWKDASKFININSQLHHVMVLDMMMMMLCGNIVSTATRLINK